MFPENKNKIKNLQKNYIYKKNSKLINYSTNMC